MIQSIVIFFLLLINVIVINKNSFKGLLFYLFLVFFSPYINVFNLAFRLELIFTPLLFLILLIKFHKMKFPKVFFYLIVIIIYLILSSINQYDIQLNSSVSWLTIYNYIRYSILFIIGYNLINNPQKLKWFLISLSIIALFVSIISLGQTIRIEFFDDLTLNFYTSESRPTYQSGIDNYSRKTYLRIFRSLGVFENVSYSASFLISSLIATTELLLNKNFIFSKKFKILLIISLFFNFLAGIVSASTTFYFGFFIFILFLLFKYRLKAFNFIKFIIPSFIFFLFLLKEKLEIYFLNGAYLFNSLIDGSKLLKRYDTSSRPEGDLNIIFDKSWFFGNGMRFYENFLVNDSLYLQSFYSFGF